MENTQSMTPCPNCSWPHHAPPTVKLTVTCYRCGMLVEINGGGKIINSQPTGDRRQRVRQPTAEQTAKREKKTQSNARVISWLRWFAKPGDTGAGDTLERLLAKGGGRKFKELMAKMSLPCGCTNRQVWLNRKYPWNPAS